MLRSPKIVRKLLLLLVRTDKDMRSERGCGQPCGNTEVREWMDAFVAVVDAECAGAPTELRSNSDLKHRALKQHATRPTHKSAQTNRNHFVIFFHNFSF